MICDAAYRSKAAAISCRRRAFLCGRTAKLGEMCETGNYDTEEAGALNAAIVSIKQVQMLYQVLGKCKDKSKLAALLIKRLDDVALAEEVGAEMTDERGGPEG